MVSLSRPAVAILLPDSEADHVGLELHAGGFDPIYVRRARELIELLATRRDVVVAVIDAQADDIDGEDAWAALHESGRSVPALLVVDSTSLDSLDDAMTGHADDEYVIRPYSGESIRWRVEAMCIRSAAVDLVAPAVDDRRHGVHAERRWHVAGDRVGIEEQHPLAPRGQRVSQVRGDHRLADAALGIEHDDGLASTPPVALVDLALEDGTRAIVDGGPVLTFDEMASVHSSGLKVLPLTSSPMATELLEPQRVAGARRNVDYVVIDAHPSYSPLNRAMLERADQILVPVTPDLPAIRALVQLRDVAADLGMVERLSLVVNRAASGISVADIEKSANLPCYAEIRSAGMLLVKANNEGRTLFEIGPRERITEDFQQLAARILGIEMVEAAKPQLRFFGRQVSVRA